MNTYEAKIEAKRERYAALAQRKAAESSALWSKGSSMLDAIPFGQPILVGHHSEKSDRAYRNRACNALDKACAVQKTAGYYADKAESVGTGGISSDDPEAIIKLKDKLVKMQAQWDEIKRQRKEGKDVWAWGVSAANIRNIKKRIEALEKQHTMEARPDVFGNGYVLRENKEDNRIQFIFDEKPCEAIRSVLKRHGFRWSPTNNAWQTYLTDRGRYQAKQIMPRIDVVTQSDKV